MRFYGSVSNNLDIVNKKYTDSASIVNYNTVSSVIGIPIDKRVCVATIDKNETLSFSSLVAGLNMDIYVVGSGSVTIENTIDGHIVIYNGVYNSNSNSSVITTNHIVEKGSKGGIEEITSEVITSESFHIFYDGTYIFIDRYYFDNPSTRI